MKIEFDIFNRGLFRILTFSLKFQNYHIHEKYSVFSTFFSFVMQQIRNKFKIQKVDKMEEKRQRNSYLSFRVT